MIPKILLQTSKNKLDQYVLDDLGNFIAGWKYLHFTDLEIVQFFKHNPLQQFPDIVEVFENIPRGEYKADLFRYYFLYLNGGVFVDSDLQLKIDLNYYVENFSYFTTQACHPNETCYFQGLLAAEPKNKIIYEALVDTYNLFKSNHQLSFYTELCHRFKQISLKHESEYLVKLFDEVPHDGYTTVFDKLTGKDVAVHFHEPGIIPPPVLGEENTSRKQIIRAVYLNYLKREPDESGLQNYLNTNLVVAEIVNDILSSQEFKKVREMFPRNTIVFANGGDQTKENIPEMDTEVENVEFIFGVGGENKMNSSSWILKEWSQQKVYRNWGHHTTYFENDTHNVKLKRLVLNTNQSISMQRHFKRNELWFVENGQGVVYTQKDGVKQEVQQLGIDDTIKIGVGEWHQLKNTGTQPLIIVEIQYGDLCVENDIERL
jgi:mannose-6-phosphate isomerase-like protein (cupin superfamily)